MGLKLVSETDFSQGPFKVFPATTSDNSFSLWLKKKAADHEGDDLESLDFPIDRIGTHSLRKGSATYVCGLTDFPSADVMKLRMEHSLGGSDDKYIFLQPVSDRRVGCSATGLNPISVDFSAF